MVAAMMGFALEDLFIKRVAEISSAGQVIAMLGVGGGIVFWIIAALRGEAILTRKALTPAAFTRTMCEGVASLLYISGLALLPLTVNSAILQATPLVVTMGAALFLGEAVGWRRWSAIFVGFIGVLLILQPGTDGFKLASLLTVGGVIFLAGRDLVTRIMPRDIGTFQITTWAYLSLIVSGTLLMFIAQTPLKPIPMAHWGDLSGAILFGLMGYWAITTAMRKGELSVISPFRYVRLVCAMFLGIIFLGESPSALTLLGAAVVIASGIYTLWRENIRKRVSSLPKSH